MTNPNAHQFQPDDPCPCGSGKAVRDCCQRNREIAPKQHLPPFRPSKSGASLRRCYARCLNDCDGSLSREHYISATLLRRLEKHGLVIEGFPWQCPGESQGLHAADLAARVLCKRHNEDLSELDSVAERFVENLERIGNEFKSGNMKSWPWLMNGHDLERWMLKVLLGMLAGKVARRQGERPLSDRPDTWVRILFGQYVFPPTWGLYVRGQIGGQMQATTNRFQFAPVSVGDQVAGMVADLSGFSLVLVMFSVQPHEAKGAVDAHSVYRPRALAFEHGGTRKEIFFHWDQAGSGLVVNHTWFPPVP